MGRIINLNLKRYSNMDVSKLGQMSREELLNLARTQGLKVHHKSKPETIIKAIMDSLQPQRPQKAIVQEAAPAEARVSNTPEQVEAALAKLKESNARFESSYNAEENTWHFAWRSARGVVMLDESGNLDIPLRTIIRIANKVAKGPLLLRGLNQHFDAMPNATGPNAYTNVVMGR